MTHEQNANACLVAVATVLAVSGSEDREGAERVIAIYLRAAAAEEREACARLADPGGLSHLFPASPGQRERQSLVSEVCRRTAAAIRARGEEVV